MNRGRMLSGLVVGAVMQAALAGTSSAQSCRDLERQLAALDAGAAPKAERYAKAIGDQQAQMSKAQAQRNRLGCGSPFARDGAGGHCAALAQTMLRMERNLATLESRHRRLADAGSQRERSRLLAALDRPGCRGGRAGRQQQQASIDQPRRSLLEQLFGGPVRAGDADRARHVVPVEPGEAAPSPSRRGSIDYVGRPQGTFRTMCVRTCDGYFFPVSYASSADEFGRDEAACATMCPGTEVRLYMHRVPEEETDRMVSRAGTPYTDLPAAFLYRNANFVRPPSCSCNPVRSSNFSILGEAQRNARAPAAGMPPAPSSAILQFPPEEAETGIAAGAAGNPQEAMPDMPAQANSTSGEEEERRVRVVGPAFLPVPAEAADRQAPDRSHVR